MTRPRHRRTRSLDSADSLERLEAHQQYRQQFLATRAKFNHNQALSSTPKPRAVKSLPPASQNHEANAYSFKISNANVLLIPPTNQILACGTLSYTSETLSSVSSGGQSDAKTVPLTHEKSRSVTPLSEIIQKFTSEISSLKLQSQSSVKGSLDSESNDVSHTSWESTAGSLAQSPMVSSTFQANTTNHDTVKPVFLAAPLQTQNLVQPTEGLDQHSGTEIDSVVPDCPSDFRKHPNSTEPLSQQSLMANTDSEAVETHADTPVARRVQIKLKARPFIPPEWIKVPVTSVDQTDAAQSQIPLLPSSAVVLAGSSTQPSSVAQPLMTRASSFHSYPVRKRSSSTEFSVSSPPHLRSQGQRLSDFSTDQNLSSEEFARQAIQTKKAPNVMAMTGSSTEPPGAQPCPTRASSFHSYPVTEGSTSYGASISSLPYLRSQEKRLTGSSRDQDLSSERFARQAIQPQKPANMPLSPQNQTYSFYFVSKDESGNKHAYNNSRFESGGRFARRSCTSSSWMSFPRRSQTPSIPVKSLVKKFSASN
jgi:hypothetical protein